MVAIQMQIAKFCFGVIEAPCLSSTGMIFLLLSLTRFIVFKLCRGGVKSAHSLFTSPASFLRPPPAFYPTPTFRNISLFCGVSMRTRSEPSRIEMLILTLSYRFESTSGVSFSFLRLKLTLFHYCN